MRRSSRSNSKPKRTRRDRSITRQAPPAITLVRSEAVEEFRHDHGVEMMLKRGPAKGGAGQERKVPILDRKWCQKRHRIRSFFRCIFKSLSNSVRPKSPQKARKWRLMDWFDAFLGTQDCFSASGRPAKPTSAERPNFSLSSRCYNRLLPRSISVRRSTRCSVLSVMPTR